MAWRPSFCSNCGAASWCRGRKTASSGCACCAEARCSRSRSLEQRCSRAPSVRPSLLSPKQPTAHAVALMRGRAPAAPRGRRRLLLGGGCGNVLGRRRRRAPDGRRRECRAAGGAPRPHAAERPRGGGGEPCDVVVMCVSIHVNSTTPATPAAPSRAARPPHSGSAPLRQQRRGRRRGTAPRSVPCRATSQCRARRRRAAPPRPSRA